MEDIYESLGFRKPDYIENLYGIKIYIGTKGNEDWCIEIPQKIAKFKCYNYNLNYNYVIYLTSEEEVLRIAKEFTELARSFKGRI